MSHTVFFPAAGANEPMDGVAVRGSVNEIFTTIRGGAGTFGAATQATPTLRLVATTTTDQFSSLGRHMVGFNIDIGTDQVTSATFSLVVQQGSSITNLGSPVIELVSATPANTNDMVSGDYAISKYGTTKFATGITTSALSDDDVTYNDWTLNASGRTHVANGVIFFGNILNWDFDNSFGGTWASAATSGPVPYHADQTGTDKDPKLVVVHIASNTSRFFQFF